MPDAVVTPDTRSMEEMNKRTWLRLLAALMAFAMLTAACSSDGDDSDTVASDDG
ncbi:MAG: hypothetical protein GY745_12255, partial [Actinomycetia bacterium]|nr:hypothetical protein [Actinomycetes bacterium]MCP4085809.1 hypothetical protein [Actinomycetes bacterium]